MSSCQTLPLHLNNSGPWIKSSKLPRGPTTEHVHSRFTSTQNTTNLKRPLSQPCVVTRVSRAFWNRSKNGKLSLTFWQGENPHIQFQSIFSFCSFSCGRQLPSSEEQVGQDTTVDVFAKVTQNEKWPCRWAGGERKERKATLYPTLPENHDHLSFPFVSVQRLCIIQTSLFCGLNEVTY